MVNLLLIAVIVVASYTDLKDRKVYNILTFPAAIIGLLLALFTGGFTAFISNCMGLALGFLLLMPLFIMRGVGGGDVKLLAAVGAIGGYPFILWTIVYMAVIGGVMATSAMVWRKRLKASVKEAGLFIRSMAVLFIHPEAGVFLPESQVRVSLPYGVAISLGVCMAMLYRF